MSRRIKPCPFASCVVCGGCAVCEDFHDYTGAGCCRDLSVADGGCPYRWRHRVRDWFRRLGGPYLAPWDKER